MRWMEQVYWHPQFSKTPEKERKKHHNQAAAPEPVSSPGEKAGNETRLRSRSAMRD